MSDRGGDNLTATGWIDPDGGTGPAGSVDSVTGLEGLTQQTRRAIEAVAETNDVVVASSSFQSQSLPLLHMLSQIGSIPVYFIDTGYHFPDTHRFRQQLSELLDLEVVAISSPISKSQQRSPDGRLLFASDPDYCCQINKTAPMERVASEADVWITGVRRDQNANRSQLEPVMQGPGRSRRFHPMLDWDARSIWAYIRHHGLPRHPLEDAGYLSIGCAPCTRRVSAESLDDPRADRWFGIAKTECGLHVDLVR